MTSKHCGERMVTWYADRFHFVKFCVTCRKRFIQHKRMAKAK